MRPVPDDGFKLRFPVAKDRTLRRIAIVQILIRTSCISSIILFCISSFFINDHPNGTRVTIKNAADAISIFSALVFAFSFPAAWIVGIIESRVFIRRYGWRAVSDPIEAQRIAMREALYDVATGSTQAMPDNNGDRIIVVPTRRLRPVGARLELTAERDKAQGSRGAR
ncbi:MAG: hypothetical protein WAS21_23590 [Geminicoccaceae bacterium]